MVRVSVPFDVREGKLIIQKLTWPNRCPCCKNEGRDPANPLQTLPLKGELTPDASDESRVFPLAWDIPYCTKCISHLGFKSSFHITIYAVVVLAWVFIGLWFFLTGRIGNPMVLVTLVLALGMLLYMAYLANQLFKIIVIRLRMSSSCTIPGYAVSVSSQGKLLTFTFMNDGYANDFADANGLSLESLY
jgi:hypothetical protein